MRREITLIHISGKIFTTETDYGVLVYYADYKVCRLLNSSGVMEAYFLKNLEKYELSEKLSW